MYAHNNRKMKESKAFLVHSDTEDWANGRGKSGGPGIFRRGRRQRVEIPRPGRGEPEDAVLLGGSGVLYRFAGQNPLEHLVSAVQERRQVYGKLFRQK